MEKNHVLSDSLLDEAQHELSRGNHWVAYNTKTYFLDNGDMYFFPSNEEAYTFADDNISDADAYAVIRADSIEVLLKQFPYGQHLEKQLTDPDANGLYNKDGNAFTDVLIDHFENLNNKNLPIMIEKNLDYLKTNVRNHGFGDDLGAEIEVQLARGTTEFSLQHKTEVNKREIEATLHFGKSDKSELYFFNKYDVRLKNEKDETMAQTFYINKGWGVTLKEAYNLLNGRAVYKELAPKEGDKYHAWIQLDFSTKDKYGNYERKQYHENYGYNLKEALSYYPVKEMNKPEESQTLLKSLERGNVQMVTLQLPEKDIKVFLEANPQYKTVTLYDSKMKRMGQEQRQEIMKKPELDESKSKEKTKDLGPEQHEGKKPEKQKGKGKGEDLDTGLVKKNRTRNPGKGMSV